MNLERNRIEKELSTVIADILQEEINKIGVASLAVSGGSTPDGLFKLLSMCEIEWEKVYVFPVDERLLPNGHEEQNGTKIKSMLLQKKAKKAKFIPLLYDSDNPLLNLNAANTALDKISFPITVSVLGMGNDGHTASLFPNSNGTKEGLNTNSKERLVNVLPKEAPYQRISFTANTIKASKRLFLHIYGADKQVVLENARRSKDSMKYPIHAFLNHDHFQIYWSN